jgi:tRNA threonylcarbamoyladenosine biosynthesis protein TsaB
MIILAIDTTMAACSVAVLQNRDGGKRLVSCFEAMGRGHAEALFPMITLVMREAGAAFADLSKIAVTVGPGTFTGVRAGIAAARGIALAAKLPVVGAGSLEVMACGCARQTCETDRTGGFMVAHDARRDELYCQSFDASGSALGSPVIMTVREAARALLPSMNLVVGSGAEMVMAEAASVRDDIMTLLPTLLPDAADLATFALNLPHYEIPPAPFYLRAPDAKPQSDKVSTRA